MKLRSSHIWGLLLIVLGIVLFLNVVYDFDLPVLGILFGVLIILVGLMLITNSTGSFCPKGDDKNAVFEDGRTIYASSRGHDYNIIFSKGTIDLTGINLQDGTQKVDANCIFGHSTLRINSQVPTIIKASSVFGSIELPDGSSSSFKTVEYRAGNPTPDSACLKVEANAVFGTMRIVS